jgi:hypothetical protein
MAMTYDRQRQQDFSQRIQALESERRRVEELASSLSQQANDQWRKAIEGLVALPAAITVSIAASTLYLVGFVTRGLEVFQRQAFDASRQMEKYGQELRGEERGEERGRAEPGRPTPTA